MTRLLTILAFCTLLGFLGILVFEVMRVDLAIVAGATLLLVGIDSLRAGKS
ncbi:hypothetical protein OCGS_2561 [Oceaniovalibus guishaninsula JLT2003]|uniref:Uncharacterized protein n=1 Tax=Oceaniovalibus guishaninsula JLT2003 TaxID=1231392 RepID=K2HK77_9RHOB|nr:hypothetical protein [Oceaniovalibus guishaninsula]EKE43369.1 hypothetical protein OCGS_2561 [Oceaniovalibus guishaninsula JLT2003]